ncbi:MAG: site-2 protease family protein [Thermoplasmata archaeon]|nr:site-2 protease family protein [Thermoplasmata archaeon]
MPSDSRTYRVQYTGQSYSPYERRGIRFGRTELMHLGIAVAVLTVAFSLAFSDFFYNYDKYIANPTIMVYFLIAAFIAVATGFMLHELAHKYVAQKYGCWAEFRSDRMGLMLAIVTSFFGFVYAAPGAVFIAGRINEEQNGKISLAGPMTNVAIALAFLGIYFIASQYWFVSFVSSLGAWINIFLAGFNMIPFMPLDGAKVAHWNLGIYVGSFALIIAIGAFIYTIIPIF